MNSIENPVKNPEMNPKPKPISRRGFLKALGGVALASSGIYSALNKLTADKGGQTQDEGANKKTEGEGEISVETPEEKVHGRIFHPGEDQEAVQKILGKFDLEETHFVDIKRATESYWYQKYKNDPNLSRSLETAYLKMQPWVPELEQIFIREGVPKEFIYLAIPESHWNWENNSSKGAAGPYQIMSGTGKLFKLKIDRTVDERLDVLKSAEVCAKHLKETYDKTISKDKPKGDWDLALSGYNGSFVNKYIGHCRLKNQPIGYGGFLKFLENKVNQLKIKLREPDWTHAVLAGETVTSIAQRYDVTPEEIIKRNKMKKGKKHPMVYKNQVLKIPIRKKESKEAVYYREVAGFIENINYPGKFNAVMAIIGESGFQRKIALKKSDGKLTQG